MVLRGAAALPTP